MQIIVLRRVGKMLECIYYIKLLDSVHVVQVQTKARLVVEGYWRHNRCKWMFYAVIETSKVQRPCPSFYSIIGIDIKSVMFISLSSFQMLTSCRTASSSLVDPTSLPCITGFTNPPASSTFLDRFELKIHLHHYVQRT